LRGPDLGDQISHEPPGSAGATKKTEQTVDDCHPNGEGAAYLGLNLRAFAAFVD
jgi:hypothetical protein